MIYALSGGGAAMNYSVKAYASELVLPASGKTNEIAVLTTTPVGEHQFSVSAPTLRADGSALAAGDVWFSIGGQSNFPFNAVKKNGVYVYAHFANQYDGSAWQAMPAKIWYGGAWVDFDLRLYWEGNEQTLATGGWAYQGSGYGSVAKNAGNMVLTCPGERRQIDVRVETANPIDLTGIGTISGRVLYSGFLTGTVKLYVSATPNGTLIASAAITYNASMKDYSVDVSALSGEHYVGIQLLTNNSTTVGGGSITIYRVWAE